MENTPLSPDGFAAAMNVSRETLDRLKIYAALLAKYQSAVNLVGPATLLDPWRRHFLDSAQLFPLLPQPPPARQLQVLDIGAGAGFPGLVLAVLAVGAGRPIALDLVESDARKAAFLREAARQTGVAATVHHARLESVAPFPVDVITARAFAPLERLLRLVAPFLTVPGAHPLALLLKGRRAARELTEAAERWKMRVKSIPSVTEPGAVVLRIEDIARA